MDINKKLLFLDGVAVSATAKVLDLGFSGDFDYKNHAWNRIFVAFPTTASATDLTLKVFAKQANATIDTSATTDLIATLTIPAAKVQAGGVMAFNMPTGLKRYVTVKAAASTAPSKVTVGITNDADTDAIALGGGIDWTNYKANTLGTAITGTPIQNVSEVIGSGSSTAAETATAISTAVGAHAELTTGVHGLT